MKIYLNVLEIPKFLSTKILFIFKCLNNAFSILQIVTFYLKLFFFVSGKSRVVPLYNYFSLQYSKSCWLTFLNFHKKKSKIFLLDNSSIVPALLKKKELNVNNEG